MRNLIILAGVLQLVIVLASLAIPKTLQWKEKTAQLDSLTRSVFWTYAGYIFGTNLSIGMLSLCFPDLLIADDPLAKLVCGFILVYWGTHVLIHFVSFGKYRPKGTQFVVGECLFLSLFITITGIYTYRMVGG